ncbi:hypothetical protein D0863_14111 [Hortaea werneckii]|uniref:BRCT domain-containing protein n=1 Tax=Hortaea werneckii TaxID=91943 RepID=A0A3M7CLD6_HORWE|nr:hypothetical protein D0863_14111 [Hortaea werneckii]
MASLATESSVGSVPLNQLDAVKRQLLQTHGRPSVDAQYSANETRLQQNADDSSAKVDDSNAASDDAARPVAENDEHSAVIPESHESAYRTPAHTSPATRQVPRLSSIKSAPPAEMEAMVHQSPSQQAFKDMTRAESFHGYPGGDTQPMESQVYRDYTESMAVKSSRIDGATETPRKTMLFLGPDGKVRETYNSATSGDGEVGKTPQTLGEGDTGYIDLAHAWDGQRSQGRESATSDFDELLRSPQETQIHVGEDGTSQQRRLALLKTPTTAGHKRNRSGDLLTSAPTTTTNANKTPGYSQLFQFGKTAPALNATQMFEQTQAPSSPVPGANGEPRSDPITTRPSPNIRHTQYIQSSPMNVTTSSPVATFAAGRGLPSSTAAEPRDNYTSMRESQEKRAARLRRELHAEHGLNMLQDSSDDDGWSQERRTAQRRLQRARSEQDLSTWSKIRAPSRPGSRPSSSRKANAIVDLITPAPERFRKQGEKQDLEISDAETDADEVMAEVERNADDERPTAHEDDYDGEGMEEGEDSGEDAGDDVYDELGQTVLRSQADLEADGDDADGDEDEGEGTVHRESDMEDGDTTEVTNPEGRSPTKAFTTSNGEPIVSSTQRSAIADSQPQQQQSQPHQPEPAPPKNLSQHHSSMTSFVPGSQYAGRTSQDLATLKPSSLQRTSASQPEVGEKMPSSPPLPRAGIAHVSQPQLGESTPQDGEDASMARKDMLAQFQGKQRSIAEQHTTSETANEIPESDIAQPINSGPVSTHHEAVQDPQSQERLMPGAPYSTARTHQSSQPSPAKPAKPQHPRLTTQTSKTSSNDSPRKAAGVRRFAEIAADPTPPSASAVSAEGQDFDVMGLMDGVMTEEDRKFIEAVSSPPRRRAAKRRKLAAESGRDVDPQGQAEDELCVAPQSAEREGQAERYDREELYRVQQSELRHDEGPQQSPSKDYEPPLSTSEGQPLPRGTQESAREREAAGAAAVSQLLSTRNGKAATKNQIGDAGKAAGAHVSEAVNEQPKSAAKSAAVKQYGRKGVARSKRNSRAHEAEKIQGREQPATPAAEDRHPATETPAPATTGWSTTSNKPTNDPLPAVSGSAHAAREPQESLPVVAPHRIFALFKGQFNSFYPATHLSTSADAKTHRVRFEDQNLTSIDSHLTCPLDLRIGDLIKVDGKGWRKDVWVIVGFGVEPQTTVEEGSKGSEEVGCDVYGRTIVKVQKRSGGSGGRASLSASTGAAELKVEGKVWDVLVTNIYLTHSLWPAFAGRRLSRVEQQPLDSGGAAGRLGTPSAGLQTQDVETPGSRSRRGGTTSKVAKRTSHLREESVSSFDDVATRTGGIFSGMAFAISFGSNEAEKSEVTRLIRRNGGMILETGFDELFEIPDLDGSGNDAAPLGRSTSKNKRSVENDTEGTDDDGGEEGPNPLLRLKPQYHDLGFAALIADKHSRRAKYMQALALNLPTLSARWVTDSLASASFSSAAAARPPEPSSTTTNRRQDPPSSVPLPWPTYLLAAGESAYLSGAIRSRLLQPTYPASTARLRDIIAHRPLLLQGDGVLIVAPAAAAGSGGAGSGGKSASQAWERRKAYAFLTLALGAGRVRRVAGLEEVRGLLGGQSQWDDEDQGTMGGRWKWVYVDGDVGTASVRVFGGDGDGGKGRGGGTAGGGKGKRKRDGSLGFTGGGGGGGGGERLGDAKAMSVTSPDGRVKVVNDEFVVQSLILGALAG